MYLNTPFLLVQKNINTFKMRLFCKGIQFSTKYNLLCFVKKMRKAQDLYDPPS